jgi:hypothetical protein
MEQNLTPEQSLQVIQRMIAEAKESFMKIGPFFISWGVVLIVAGLIEFYLRQVGSSYSWVSWPIAGVLGGISAFVLGMRQSKSVGGNTTFMDRVSTYLWAAFGVALVLVLYLTIRAHIDPNPFVMIITGIPTFVTGALIKFPALKWGGVVFWLGAVVATFLPSVYSGLIFSIALFFGYLLPGILLMRKENGIRTT